MDRLKVLEAGNLRIVQELPMMTVWIPSWPGLACLNPRTRRLLDSTLPIHPSLFDREFLTVGLLLNTPHKPLSIDYLTYVPSYQITYLLIYVSIHRSIYLPVHLCIYGIYVSIYLSIYLSMFLFISICLSFDKLFYQSIPHAFHPPSPFVCLSVFPLSFLSVCPASCRSFWLSICVST